jgi:hypothetical protein
MRLVFETVPTFNDYFFTLLGQTWTYTTLAPVFFSVLVATGFDGLVEKLRPLKLASEIFNFPFSLSLSSRLRQTEKRFNRSHQSGNAEL